MQTLNSADDRDWQPTATVSGQQTLVSISINGYMITIAKRNLEHFDAQDPYFFDSDYTVAASTGFLLWEANWLVLRLLRSAVPLTSREVLIEAAGTPQKVTLNLGRLLSGCRVLDLGSGTGLAGLSAAACGAHVLLTDLPSVCEGTLRANVLRNSMPTTDISIEPAAPRTPTTATAIATSTTTVMLRDGTHCQEGDDEQKCKEVTQVPSSPGPWVGAVRVGQGSAAVMALDWTEPLEPQVQAGGNDPRDADFILAVDTIWLLDIFHAFMDVVLAVLSRGSACAAATARAPPPGSSAETDFVPGQRTCFLAFVERAGADSKLFVRKEAIEQELRQRGCEVEVLIAENMDVDGVARPGRVLRVTLAHR